MNEQLCAPCLNRHPGSGSAKGHYTTAPSYAQAWTVYVQEQDDRLARSVVQRYFAQQKSRDEFAAALHSVASILAKDDMRSSDAAVSRHLSQTFLDTGSGDDPGIPDEDAGSGDPLEEDVPEELTLVCSLPPSSCG